jgi:hypothetical protein
MVSEHNKQRQGVCIVSGRKKRREKEWADWAKGNEPHKFGERVENEWVAGKTNGPRFDSNFYSLFFLAKYFCKC